MSSGKTPLFMQQDKGMPQQSWNSLSSRDKACGNRLRQCRSVAARRWPIFVASISVVGVVLGPRLGVGPNLSRSTPRGVYRQAAMPQLGERSRWPVCPPQWPPSGARAATSARVTVPAALGLS